MARALDLGRLATGLLAIAAAAVMAVVLLLVGRGVNRPPVIVKVDAVPQPVKRNGVSFVSVNAHDPDGDKLRYEYAADTGKISPEPGRPDTAKYSPATQGPIADKVTVIATDARGLVTRASVGLTIEAAATPSPTPATEPTAEPATPPPTPVTPPPTPVRTVRTPPPTPPPTRAPTPAAAKVNQPPVLQEGSNITDLKNNPIVLVASGSEPENEPVTYNWEPGPCVELKNQSQFEAEAKLIGECSYAVVTLTWTDPHGASASCQWTLNK
jgi:Big-like domain-containing protein